MGGSPSGLRALQLVSFLNKIILEINKYIGIPSTGFYSLCFQKRLEERKKDAKNMPQVDR